MPSSSAFRRSPLRWGAVAGLVLSFLGCALSRDGLLQSSCTSDAECTSANLCEEGTCTAEGLCEFTPFDGEPTQSPGDCVRELCQDGVLTTEPDEADVPAEEECVSYTCGEDGVAVPENKPQGGSCTQDNGEPGRCDAGVCQDGCQTNDDCPSGNKCEAPVCNVVTGQCEIVFLDEAPEQEPGDCQIIVCNDGMEDVIADNTDIPVDSLECTDDICTDGVPSNPVREGEGCGPQGSDQFCRSDGKCVGCEVATQDSDCPTDTYCVDWSCVNEACEPSFPNPGNALPNGQTTGDCQVLVCGPNGVPTQQQDTGDPNDDMNDCTSQSCVGTNTQYQDLSAGTMCGMGDVCDGSGSCVECVDATQCPNATDWTCNGSNQCRKVLGVTCGGGNECNSGNCEENVCCNSSCNGPCRVCDTGTVGQCEDAAQFSTCGGGSKACDDSGNCDEVNGTACSGAGQCASGFCEGNVCCDMACVGPCKTCTSGTCGNEPQFTGCGNGDQCDTGGTCVEPNGEACVNASDCASENCVNDTCCSTAMCGANETCDTVQGDGVCRKIVGEMCNNDDECATNDCNNGNNMCQ